MNTTIFNTLKKNLITTALTVLTLSSTVAFGAEKTYSLTLSDPSKPASLEIELYNGTVTVEGYSGKTVEIIADISDAKENEGRDKLGQRINQRMKQKLTTHKSKPRSTEGLKVVSKSMLRLEIEEDDNEVEISSESMNQHVNLVVKVPMTASLDIEVYQGGDITINNISGGIEVEAYQGSVTATGISGPIVAETANTDIVVSFSDFDKTNPSSLTSHAGNVDITLAKSIAANVNVQTYQGELYSGLTQEFSAIDEVKQNSKGGKQKIAIGGILQAKMNGGGQDLSLISYSGNLYVRDGK